MNVIRDEDDFCYVKFDLFFSTEMQEAEDSVQEVCRTGQHTQTAHSQANFSLGGEARELVLAQVSVPVVESCSSHCDPHEAAHKVHDDLLKFQSDALPLVV